MLLGRSEQGFIYVFEEPVRILAVDDDPIMREMAMAQLSHPGGEIVTAENGREAWDILAGDAAFDLVLSDLEMPQMTGFGLCASIREDARFARLPVVVLTGRDDMFAIDRAYEVGATAFATKPVNWRMLGYQLRYVLRNRRENEAALAAMKRDLDGREAQDAARAIAAPGPAGTEPDPVACLRILMAQPPAQIAAIVARLDDPGKAGAILRHYADLIAASRAEAAKHQGEAGCGAYPDPARDDATAQPPRTGDSVAALRAQLRQAGQNGPEADTGSRNPMCSLRFLASGGR